MSQIDEVKAALQVSARAAWRRAGSVGTIVAGTGAGKSKMAIDEMNEICSERTGKQRCILLVTPTINLRDTNWPEEIARWYPEEKDTLFGIQAECYASLHKVRSDVPWDLVVFDEIHHLTVNNAVPFFKNNFCKKVMGLTATAPDYKGEAAKWQLIKEYCPVCFEYKLDQGVDDGIIADFRITVIKQSLDGVTKNIPAGTKDKPFMTTEVGQYNYMTKCLNGAFAMKETDSASKKKKYNAIKFATLRRMHFLCNLPSKTALAFQIIERICDLNIRTLIFCGSIDQCEKLCAPFTWHSKNQKKKPTKKDPEPRDTMDDFRDGIINVLGVVAAANEGINVPDLDQALIVQSNSSEREMIQRIGRMVRKRPGYVAKIYILVAAGTQDEKWVEEALSGFKKERIEWIESTKFLKQNVPV